jgi:hypothetical protein
MIQIDKNIPIPECIRRGKYPFHVMSVGDSFLLPQKINVSAAATLISHARKKDKNKNWVKARERDSIRIWRVK